MGCGCTFYESATWENRLETHVGRIWDLETTLRKLPNIDAQAQIEMISGKVGLAPTSVAVTQLVDVLSMDGAEDLEVSLADATAAWQAEQSWLPETCPYETVLGTDRCSFHLSPAEYETHGVTTEEVQQQLRNTINQSPEQGPCFIGAHFHTLDLADAYVDRTDSRPIDFRLVTVEETVNCSDVVFERPISMEGAIVGPDDVSSESRTGHAPNRYISVDGDIDFSGAQFNDSVDFKHVWFRSGTTFNGATFEDVAMFNYACFDGDLELWASFIGKADFSKAQIAGTAQIRGHYETAAIFNYTQFDGDVVLWNSTIEGKAEFLAAKFDGQIDAGHVTFGGLTRFCETTFNGTVDFRHAQFADEVRFRRVRAPDQILNLQGAKMAAGEIELTSNTAHFDLKKATLGAVSITRNMDDSSIANPLGYLRILQTDFRKFDFSAHSGALKPDWRLDELAESWPAEVAGVEMTDDDQLTRYEKLEDTYLRAKSGANEAGHNKSASEFFVHEMTYRRKQYGELFRYRIRQLVGEKPDSLWQIPLVTARQILKGLKDIGGTVLLGQRLTVNKRAETPAWKAGYRWASNGSLGLIAGYGERPQRPIAASVVMVVVFAGIYYVLAVSPTSEAPYGLGYLLLSLQSFITFILGSSPVDAGFVPQILSAIEGFVGAFFIAVFVFSLTRSIHR